MDNDSSETSAVAAVPANAKENVDNKEDFSPLPRMTPRKQRPNANARSSSGRASRTAASLFSPTPYASRTSPSASFAEQTMAAISKKPDPFPDNWEEAMGGGGPSSASKTPRSSSSRKQQQHEESFGYGSASQVR